MNAQLNIHQFNFKGIDSLISLSSLNSFLRINDIKGKKIIFTPDDKFLFPSNGWGSNNPAYDSIPINKIYPKSENTVIAGIDSSCIRIAESEEGTLYAAKCGIALSNSLQVLMHFRIGPIIFYITEKTLSNSDLDRRLIKMVLLDSESAKRMIRINIERTLQFELSKVLNDSVILIDGSLKLSQYESRYQNINRILENCALRKNSLIGLSKCSKIKILNKISDNLRTFNNPGIMDISFIIKSIIKNTIGNNTLVKLTKRGLIFRADVISMDNNSDFTNIFCKLLGNDAVPFGYPESLRLAHHISSFSSTEISGLRGHIMNNYDVKELYPEDIRRKLLGLI